MAKQKTYSKQEVQDAKELLKTIDLILDTEEKRAKMSTREINDLVKKRATLKEVLDIDKKRNAVADKAADKRKKEKQDIDEVRNLGKDILKIMKEQGVEDTTRSKFRDSWLDVSKEMAKAAKLTGTIEKKRWSVAKGGLMTMEDIHLAASDIGTEEFQSYDLTKQIAAAKKLGMHTYAKELEITQELNNANKRTHKIITTAGEAMLKPFEKMDSLIRQIPMGDLLADVIGIKAVGEKAAKSFKGWIGGKMTAGPEVLDKSKEVMGSKKQMTKVGGKAWQRDEKLIAKGEFKREGKEGGEDLGEELQKGVKKKFNAMKFGKILGIGLVGGFIVAIGLLAKAFVGVVKGAMQMQKELGVGFGHAVNLGIATREAAAGGFMYGESLEDTTARASSLVEEWGVINRETIKSVEIVTDLERNYGIAASSAASIAELMEATSSSTKDVLLANMGGEMYSLQKLGIPVGKVMEEVASDTDFFATHMRRGGKNIIQAAGFAKKLGMSMSTISGAAESLLDFESSVTATMEASMMLGRQVNTDRARQLAMAGDFVGMQKEIIKQVGSEAQFNRMNFLQRKKLAAAFGLSVTDLAGMVSAQEKLNRMGPIQTQEMEDAQAASEAMQKTWGAIVSVFRIAYSKFVAPMVKKLLEMFGISMDLSSGFEMSKKSLEKMKAVISPLVQNLADGFFKVIGYIKEWWDPHFKQVKDILTVIVKKVAGFVTFLAENKTLALALVGIWAANKLGILSWVGAGIKALGSLIVKFGAATIAKNTLQAPTAPGGLLGLAAGLTAMGTGRVALGSLNLGLFGIAAIPALLGIPFLLFMAFGGGAAGMGLMGLASGLTAMGTGTVAKGALVLGLLGITLGIFAYALTFFTGIDFKQVLLGGIALAGFAIAVGVMGIPVIAGAIALGSLVLLGLSLALMVFVPALKLFTGIDFEQVSKGVSAIVNLGLAFSALGLMIPFIFLGAIALTFISVAMVPFAGALMIMSMAMAAITPNLETFTPSFEKLAAIGGGALLGTAAGIAAIGGALLVFGGGGLLSGIASGIGKFFGGDPVRKFERFAAMAPGLKMAATAMKDLSKGMRDVNKLVGPTFQLALAFNSLADSANRVSKATMGSLAVGVINTVGGAIQGTITNVGRLIGVVERERVNVEAPVINMDMTKTNKKLDSVVAEIIEMRTVLRGAITKLSQQ